MDLDIGQYINIFVEESREHLQIMNDVMLELEKNPSDLGHINEIFRVAHTLKGMSGTMGFHNMANLTHEMENLLQAARSEEISLSQEVIDILFECFDALDLSVNKIIEEGVEDEDTNEGLINEIRRTLNQELVKDDATVSKALGMELDTYTLEVISKASDKGSNAFRIKFTLEEACMLKSARAFIIFSELEDLGEVIYSNPSVEDIEDEKFESSFDVILITEETKEVVTKKLSGISEVKSVEIDLYDQNEISKEVEKHEKAQEVQKKPESTEKVNKQDSAKKPQASQATGKIGKTVRVDIDRLDNLMNLVSELIIIKTRMDDLSESSSREDMGETIEYLERITTSLHDAVMKVRMVPIERVFNRFPRLVRDLSRDLNKDIELQMSGEETEVDRTVIDEIGDPLIHLIRNSIDHGIELPEEREKAGKSRQGTVILKSYPDGNNVVIQVEDDGKGIDHEVIKRKSTEKGIISEREAENLSVEDSISLLFAPGFSTTEEVSDVSGRGVGLDVVKSKIESINGNIEVLSEKGKGSKFIIRIPLTLAIIQALLVKLQEEIYAIPLSSIIEITTIEESSIRDIQGQEMTLYRGTTIPIVRLNEIMNLEASNQEEELTVIIIRKGDKQAGVIVDSLIGQQEIVIKGLGKYLNNVNYISGATILGNGSISLIVDVNSLI